MGNTIPHGDRLHECNVRCPEWAGDVQPLPGMPPAPPQPKMSDKARDVVVYINQQGLTDEEFGEVMAALLLSKISGGLMGALKDLGLDV